MPNNALLCVALVSTYFEKFPQILNGFVQMESLASPFKEVHEGAWP
jgi:hypothetical protein